MQSAPRSQQHQGQQIDESRGGFAGTVCTSAAAEVGARAEQAAAAAAASRLQPAFQLDTMWNAKESIPIEKFPNYVKARSSTMSFPEKVSKGARGHHELVALNHHPARRLRSCSFLILHCQRLYQLMLMLQYVESSPSLVISGRTPPIAWTLEGLAFVVRDREELVKAVLPKFFPHGKFESFTRKLYRWGFRQVMCSREEQVGGSSGTAATKREISFASPFFQRDRTKLMVYMKSVTAAGRRRQHEKHQSEVAEAAGSPTSSKVVPKTSRPRLSEDVLERTGSNLRGGFGQPHPSIQSLTLPLSSIHPFSNFALPAYPHHHQSLLEQRAESLESFLATQQLRQLLASLSSSPQANLSRLQHGSVLSSLMPSAPSSAIANNYLGNTSLAFAATPPSRNAQDQDTARRLRLLLEAGNQTKSTNNETSNAD